MLVLGISCGHDANVCLVNDEGVLVHYEKERFTGKKHDSGAVDELVRLALADTGHTIDDVDLIASSQHLFADRGITGEIVSGEPYASVFEHSRHEVELFGKRFPAIYVPHHLGHMAYAYYYSPFDDADVIAVDAWGNFTATTIGAGTGAQLRTTHNLPGNIGMLWAVTSLDVFGNLLDAGKLMGLAPFGDPRFLEGMRSFHMRERDGFTMPMKPWRDKHGDIPFMPRKLQFPGRLRRFDPPWVPASRRIVWENRDVMDYAASLQALTNETMVGMARTLQRKTGRTNLCLSGGVALNGIANEALYRAQVYENVFIPPAVYDGGLSLGFALYAYAEETGTRPRADDPRYLSRAYSADAVDEAGSAATIRYRTRKVPADDVPDVLASALADGQVVALWTGRAESGPRALGHRSILSDPRPEDRRDHINFDIKSREAFRPFGPTVLAERAGEICEMAGDSPYMLRVVAMPPRDVSAFPAVRHVDDSTRPQTVGADDAAAERVRKVMEAFAHKTDCPAVLNTSFNIRGRPIVESPLDAVDAFSAVPFDMLVLEDWVIERNGN